MELAIMLEGQHGLNWARWQRWGQAVEDLGFAGLYRSDHFTNGSPPDLDSLELWISLAWLASHTHRIEFGPLVTPVSFRHPVFTARMARDVDDLSGGRLRLGVGAGWQQREHKMFGFELLPRRERFDRFEEGLEVITRLLQGEERASFSGRYYRLSDAALLPRPLRPAGPPIVIGGNGEQRTLPLAARFAAEWNAVMVPPAEFRRLSAELDADLARLGRPVESVRRTLMQQLLYARSTAELEQLLTSRSASRADMKQRGAVIGEPEQVIQQLQRYQEAGVSRIMLQWLELDDFDRLEHFAAQVLPAFQ